MYPVTVLEKRPHWPVYRQKAVCTLLGRMQTIFEEIDSEETSPSDGGSWWWCIIREIERSLFFSLMVSNGE